MGRVTLQQYRDRLQLALGNMGYADSVLDQWINAGMQEVAGAVEFENSKRTIPIDLVADTYEYGLPEDTLAVVSVGWPGERRWLVKSSAERMDRLSRITAGKPRVWAPGDRFTFLVHPTPDADSTVYVKLLVAPAPLQGKSDTSPWGPTWDEAIYRFAASAAFYDLADDERGLLWHNRAVMYAGSRLTDREHGSEAISEPVRVIQSEEDLYRQSGR